MHDAGPMDMTLKSLADSVEIDSDTKLEFEHPRLVWIIWFRNTHSS